MTNRVSKMRSVQMSAPTDAVVEAEVQRLLRIISPSSESDQRRR